MRFPEWRQDWERDGFLRPEGRKLFGSSGMLYAGLLQSREVPRFAAEGRSLGLSFHLRLSSGALWKCRNFENEISL